MAKVFFSYSHVDEVMRDQLEVQLSMLKRQAIIETWHDRRIGAGKEIERDISRNLEEADIILLLVSSNFLASDYCYEKEMSRALQRHEAGDAIVIPVILRACEWHHAPFGKLNATPPDGKPISQAADPDQAFLEVAKAIREAAKRLPKRPVASVPPNTPVQNVDVTARDNSSQSRPRPAEVPRSSNLRIAKRFTDRDKDLFKLEAFEYMARFFEASLDELANRNPEIDCNFRRIDGSRFSAVIYINGKAAARCTIFVGGDRGFLNGISYVASETTESNSYNESLNIDNDEQAIFLRSMGMSHRHGSGEHKLSEQGAAELYWGMLIEPLQRGRWRD